MHYLPYIAVVQILLLILAIAHHVHNPERSGAHHVKADPKKKPRSIGSDGTTDSLFDKYDTDKSGTVKNVHLLILALDYPGTGQELTCTADGNNVKHLAEVAGVSDIVMLTNNEANKKNVLLHIQDVASRCEEGDYFVFNYSGHGVNVQDKDGDEADGMDEALCLVTPEGAISWPDFLTDDEFAVAITSATPHGVKILILCDCCHSGTIGDFKKECWDGVTAVSLSGCTDNQTSGDTGRGGIFTHSMLMAIEGLQQEGKDDYSVAQMYNNQVKMDEEVFDSKQDITMKWTREYGHAHQMAWPFVPAVDYRAPWQGPRPNRTENNDGGCCIL